MKNRIAKAVSILKAEIKRYSDNREIELCISEGNNKIGRIKNISVAPILSCNGVCGTCAEHCYDIKSVLQYPEVASARARNFVLLKSHPMEFYLQARQAIKAQRKKLFRFNVGGELYSLTYLQIIVKLAEDFPETKILLFTKKHFLVNAYCERNGGRKAIPENLKLIFSFWPGMTLDNPFGFPVSCPYPENLPKGWKECSGNCEYCAEKGIGCWNLKSGETVGFKYHGTESKAFEKAWKESVTA